LGSSGFSDLLDHAASASFSFVLVLRARNRNRNRYQRRRIGAKAERVQFEATAFNRKASMRRQSLPECHLGLGEHWFRPTACTRTLHGERAPIPERFARTIVASTITITRTRNEHDNEKKYAETG
jgi:hypothetical protein